MSNHLTSEQISKWMIGESTPEEQRHGRECVQCRTELASLQTAISEFRGFVAHWADRQRSDIPDAASLLAPAHHFATRPLRWLPVAAVVAVLAIIPVYWNSIERQREAQAVQDAQLLEKVNAHLARNAPASFEPLMDLLSGANDTQHQNDGGLR